MSAAAAVDALAPAPLVVVGSLPPEGRDLDLIAPSATTEALRAALCEAGFLARGHELAFISGPNIDVVELHRAEGWDGLPGTAIDTLLARARPLPGLTHIRQPDPTHVLLLLARRVARNKPLQPKHHARAALAMDEDPRAPEQARLLAAAWGVTDALEFVLRPREPATGTARSPRLRRRRVVALSGLDGSGKSTQADVVAGGLHRMGHDVGRAWARVEWNTLTTNAVIQLPARGATAIRRLVAAPRRRRLPAAPKPAAWSTAAGVPDPPAPLRGIRERVPGLTHAWVLVIAVLHGLTLRREVRAAGTAMVVCDRYVLDAMVHLRWRYGDRHRFRVQRRIMQLIAPTPVRSYLFEVSGDTARARKDDQYSTEELQQQARIYAEEAARLGVTRVDGQRPPDEISERLLRELWHAVGPPS